MNVMSNIPSGLPATSAPATIQVAGPTLDERHAGVGEAEEEEDDLDRHAPPAGEAVSVSAGPAAWSSKSS